MIPPRPVLLSTSSTTSSSAPLPLRRVAAFVRAFAFFLIGAVPPCPPIFVRLAAAFAFVTSSLRPIVVSSSLRAALVLLPFFLAACGGGGSAGGGPAPPGPPVLTAPDLTDQAAQTFTAGVALPAAVVFVNAAGGALLADDAVPAAGCLASAELPEGLAVLRTTDTDSCRIIGTPAVGSVGVYLVTVTAVNSAGTDVTPAAVTITIAPATPVVSVPFNSLGTRQAGVSVSSVVGGTVHALLLPTGMAAPAAEAFAAGAGVMSLVVAAGASADFTFTGLAPATAYTAHAVLSTADSVSSAVGDDSFMTMALPEVLTASITRVAGRELDISVTAAPAGTLYLLVRADTDAGLAPDSATALMTAVVDGGAGAYSEELAFDDNVAGDIVLTAGGLSPGVPYTVYLATANSAGDLSALVTRMAQTYAPQFAAPSARTIYLIKDVLYDNTVDAANNAMPDTPGQFIDPRYVDDNDIRGTIVECTLVAVDGQAVDTNDPLRQLPAGVSLAVLATGIGCAFTGTPTTFTPMREYTLTATDDSNAVSDSYSVRVKVIEALAPNIQSILGGPVILEQNRTYAEATVEMPEATPAVRFVNRGGPPNAATDVPAGCTALNLPEGLMVERTGDGNSCQIIGTPLAVTNGAVAISIWVRNSNGADLRLAAVSIVVRPAVVIVPLPNLDDADAVTRTALELIAPIVFTNNGGGFLLADDAGSGPGCTAVNLPEGLMIGRTDDGNSCQITGTSLAATAGAVTVTVTARNATGADLSPATVSIIVRPAVVIVPLPNLDDADAVTRTALELIAPIVFTNNGGGFLLADDAGSGPGCTAVNLPEGLMIGRTDDGNSCQITGTSLAATAGAVTVTVTARNATGADVTVATVVVIIRPPPEIIPILRVDAVIDFVVTALDQSFVFTNIGAGEISECTADKVLPMGLRLAPTTNRSSCQITGTPLALTIGAGVAYNIEARNPFGASMVAATIAVRPAMPRLEDSGRVINLYVGTSTTVDIVNSGIDVSQSDGCAVIGDVPFGLNFIESYMQDNGRRSCRFITSNRDTLQADHTFLIRGTADSGALDYTRVAVRVLAPPAPPPLCVAHDAYLADVDDNLGDGGAYPVSAGGNDGFLYLTGAHSDGRAYPGYIFRYKGTNDEDNHVYQATIAFDATDAATGFSGDDATFIITSDDLQTRFAVQSGQATSVADVRSTHLLTDGTVHPVARGTAADITGHNQADFSLDDAYLFTLTLATADPAQGLNAGTLSVQACTDTAKPTLALPAANSTTAASAHAVAVHVRSTGQAAQARILVRPASDTAPSPTAADIMASASAISQAISADGNVPLFVTGLSPETAYNAYVVSIDQAGNTSEILSTSFSTTATADTMPVAVTAPALEGVGAHSATLKVSASETGELFAIVLPSTDSAPTSAADITSSADVIEVDIPPPLAPDGTTDVRATFSGLLSGEDYKIYYVAIDVAGNTTAVLPSASGLTFTTTLTLPALTSISPVTLELGIEIEPIIWPNTGGGMLIGDGLALACNARVSASDAVPLGLVASVTADGRSCQITGAPMTETAEPVLVKIFANNRVGAGNNRRSSAVAIRVRDTLAPVLQLATAPTEVVSDITEFSASVAYAANEGGTLYTLVLGAESAAPDMATIKAMAGGDGGVARAVQTIAGGAGIVSLSGLMPGEMYTAYLVMEDDALTPSPSAVVSVDFSSNTMTLASPRLANLDDQTFVVGDTLETPLVFVNEGGGAIHPDGGSPPGCTGVAIPPGLIVSRTMDGSSCQFTGTLTTPGIGTAMVTASNIAGTTTSPATVMYTVTPAVPVVLAISSRTIGRAIITIPHDGIVYGLILTSDQSPPSVDVIQRDGVMVTITPSMSQSLVFDGLIAETTYTAYVVVRSNGLVSPIGSNSFTTPPLPVISVTAAATNSTMATVTVNHSTPGQLDVILLPADATPPASPSDIEAMSLHPNYRERDINENEMSSVFGFFGLTPGTSYIGYAFIEASLDGTATNSAVTASAPLTTVNRVTISVINFTGTGGATAIVTSNLAGTAYGLLIQDGTAPAPTDASAVIGHSDVQSMTIASGLPVALPITGLTVGLSYTYYAVVTSGDVGVEVAAHTFTAPTVLFIDEIGIAAGGTTATVVYELNITQDVLATVFALVQLDTAPPPTTHGEIGTEIIAGNANVFGALLPGQGAGTNTLMVTGLTVNTGYTAYLAAIDANNINTDTIEQIDFRTSPPRLEGDGATAFLRSTVDRESSPAFLLDARTSGQIGRASGLINSCDVVAETSGGTVRELPAGLSVVVSTDGHGCVVVGTSQVFTQPTTEYFIAATDSEGLVSEPASLRIKLIESNAPDFRTAITEGLLERGFDYSGANAIRIVNIGSAPNADDAEPRGCVQTTAIGQLTVRRSDDGETCIIEGSFADDYDGNSVSVNILASTNSHVIDEVLTENARVTFGFIDTQTAAPVVSSDYGEHRLRSFLFDVDYSSVAPAVGTGPNPVHYSVPFLGPQSGKVGFCRLAQGSPALPFGLNLVPSPDGARCVVTVIGEGNLSPTVYTIIASNSVGSSTPSTLRIEVADEFFEPPSLSLADQTFVLNTTISPAVATANAGSKLSTTLRDACQLTNSSNDLPAGLMITLAEDGNSCEISGTPATLTAPEGVDISISYPTDIANNASATLEFNIKVINAPGPSNPIERTYFTTNQEYNNEPSSNANSRAAVAGDSDTGGAVAEDSNAGGAVAGDSNAGGAVAGDSSAPLRDRRAVVTSSGGGAAPRPSNSRGSGYFAIGQAYGDGLSGNADAGDSNARGSSAPLRDRRAVVTSSSGGAAPRLIGPADTAYFAIGQAYGDGLGGNTGKLDSPVQFRDRRAADTYSSGWVQRCELASVNGQTPSTTDPSRRLPEGLSLVVTHNKDSCAVVGKASEYTATRVYTFKAFDINNNVHTPVSARIRVVTGFKPNIEWQDETTSGIFFEDNANYTGASALRLRNIGAPPTANGCTLTATNPQTNTIVATGLSATRSHDGETCLIEGLYTANTAEKNIVLTLSITSAPEADAQTEQYRYAGARGADDQPAQYGYAGARGSEDRPSQYGYAGALGAGTQTEVYVYSVRSMGEGFSKQTSPVVVSDRYGQDRLRSASVGVGLAQNGSDNIAVHFADPGGGEIAFCRLSEESPPLPAGLAVTIASNRRSCAVQGTPTQVSAPAIYTIIALNSANVDRRLAVTESVGVGRSTADGVGVGVGSAGSENADEGSADDGSGGGGPAMGSLRLEVLATDEVYASGTYRMPSLSLADQTLTVGAAISPAIAFTNSGAKLSTTLREACRLTAASAALLPAGLEITLAKDGSTCEISGTATTATAPEGIELSVEYPTDLTNANGLTIFTLIVNPGS